jgi:spore coat protein U-like protein
MRFRLSIFAFSLALSTLVIGHAAGATASASFSVSATVQAGCVVSAQPLRFGINVGAAPSGASPVSVNCTHSTPYNIGIIAAAQPNASRAEWNMRGPESSLRYYALSSNSARIVNWAQKAESELVTEVSKGALQALLVDGHIPAAQFVASGAYTDAIIVTVTY